MPNENFFVSSSAYCLLEVTYFRTFRVQVAANCSVGVRLSLLNATFDELHNLQCLEISHCIQSTKLFSTFQLLAVEVSLLLYIVQSPLHLHIPYMCHHKQFPNCKIFLSLCEKEGETHNEKCKNLALVDVQAHKN